MKNVEENLNEKTKENNNNNSNLEQLEISSKEIFSFNIWLLINFGFCKKLKKMNIKMPFFR